jgi:hypothetical protein
MMWKRLISLAFLAAVALAVVTATAGADCSTSACRADVGIWGSAIPSPITPGETSLLYFTAKNNGPNSAYGIDMHVTVPYELRIEYVRDYSAASPCTVKGTFVNCYLGNFKREQLATVVIKVQPRGEKGTYEIPAHVYSQGVVDVNPGNNQVTATLGVYAKGHGA